MSKIFSLCEKSAWELLKHINKTKISVVSQIAAYG